MQVMQEADFIQGLQRGLPVWSFQRLHKPSCLAGGQTVQGSRRRAGEAPRKKVFGSVQNEGLAGLKSAGTKAARLRAGTGDAGGIKFSAS